MQRLTVPEKCAKSASCVRLSTLAAGMIAAIFVPACSNDTRRAQEPQDASSSDVSQPVDDVPAIEDSWDTFEQDSDGEDPGEETLEADSGIDGVTVDGNVGDNELSDSSPDGGHIDDDAPETDAMVAPDLAQLVEYCMPLAFRPVQAPVAGERARWEVRLSTSCGYYAGEMQLYLTNCTALGDERVRVLIAGGPDGLLQTLEEDEETVGAGVLTVSQGIHSCTLELQVATRAAPVRRQSVESAITFEVLRPEGGNHVQCAGADATWLPVMWLGSAEPALVRCAVFDEQGELAGPEWQPRMWSLFFNASGLGAENWVDVPPWIEIAVTPRLRLNGFVVGAQHAESGLHALPSVVRAPL